MSRHRLFTVQHNGPRTPEPRGRGDTNVFTWRVFVQHGKDSVPAVREAPSLPSGLEAILAAGPSRLWWLCKLHSLLLTSLSVTPGISPFPLLPSPSTSARD